ncbi:MAG: glycosyltransferase family 4 protein [Clostridiales bacterium]|jgi:glycosyltransferase involved in cell wall biosynthesis|nr:glycosyltransferase family 4 protein [Clostridiales bacterium]
MNILVVCQYYYPEPFRVSDICEELVRRGNSVTVVTGIPNYPMGEIYDGYRHGEKRDEVINGVRVHRCFTIGRRHGAVYRFLNYCSYAFSSARYISKLNGDYDAVFVNQLSPVMMANAGIKYKKKHRKKLILYCLDLWPESLVSGGIKRGSPIYGLFHKISERIYKSADRIFITSKSFSDYFKEEFGIENTEYLPQYAEALFTPEQCEKHPDETIDLMFAGNVGAAQSVKTIVEAANLTRDIETLRWHIVGDGSEFDNVKKLSESYKLTSVIFHGRQPIEKMPEYYAMADAMLVTMQKDPVLSMTLPGKVQTYMAAGKPIVGAVDGETQKLVCDAGCGVCGAAENAQELAQLCREISSNPELLQQWSRNTYSYYCEFFSKNRFMDALIKALTDAAIPEGEER